MNIFIIKQYFKLYIRRVGKCLSQMINVILFFGDEDETLSSRIGKIKRINNGVVPFFKYPIFRIIDIFLEKVDDNHTIEAIEDDECK